jgi:hypothetical protein
VLFRGHTQLIDAFAEYSYVCETNEAQYREFEIYLQLLIAITDNNKKNEKYIF